MTRFNVLSGVFFLISIVGFLISPHVTGAFIGTSEFGYINLITVISFMLFMAVFVGGKGLEAILVPTGNQKADKERARRGAKYYHEHQEDEPEVLISGSVDGQYGRHFVSSQPGHIYKYMRKGKVPKGEFIFEPGSKNTAENVFYSADVIRKKGIKKLDVVSNPSHLWRFRFLFNKARDEGLIGKDVQINYVPTRPNFLFEDVKDAIYGIPAYINYLWKWRNKPLKSLEKAA